MAAPAKEAALPTFMFCRQQGKVSSRDPQFCGFKILPFFFFYHGKPHHTTIPTRRLG